MKQQNPKHLITIKKALISVWDKSNLEEVARMLHSRGVEIYASGGTANYLMERQIPVTSIEKLTGNPEAFGGRMKTISFQIGSALLYRRDVTDDIQDAERLGITAIDLVICNLYPFAEKLKQGLGTHDLIEYIDVGGPTMIRAAAKNHAFVNVLTHPDQYADFCQKLEMHDGRTDLISRKNWAGQAFQLSAKYDELIADTLLDQPTGSTVGELTLRYGENPHQTATFIPNNDSLENAWVRQGKALSYNNLLDADTAWKCSNDLHQLGEKNMCAVTVVKHMNPCGASLGHDPLQTLKAAWNGDAVSSFGSIICFSKAPTVACLDWLQDKFVEVLVVPEWNDELEAEVRAKKNLRILIRPPATGTRNEKIIRSISDGQLVQMEDEGMDPQENWHSPTMLTFPKDKWTLAHFGILCTKYMKSNAIGIVRWNKDQELYEVVSSGMGQPNRIDALRTLALPKALEKGVNLSETVMISDAFFPFPDIVFEAYKGGLRWIVQPGGSIKDKDVVSASDELGISMLMTGRRHFRH